MYPVKASEADLKLKYKATLEVSIIASLVLHIILFRAFPGFEMNATNVTEKAIIIEVEDIPVTEQVRNIPPPPARPVVPVPSESEDIPEDLTIESTNLNLDLSELPPPPPPGDNVDDGYVFVPYDQAPVPIGGMLAINAFLRYPEIARKAGMEGTVIVAALVSTSGRTLKTTILQDSGTLVGFEKAAQAAVMQVEWKPAKQRDRAVKVWISVPIRFKLRSTSDLSS